MPVGVVRVRNYQDCLADKTASKIDAATPAYPEDQSATATSAALEPPSSHCTSLFLNQKLSSAHAPQKKTDGVLRT